MLRLLVALLRRGGDVVGAVALVGAGRAFTVAFAVATVAASAAPSAPATAALAVVARLTGRAGCAFRLGAALGVFRGAIELVGRHRILRRILRSHRLTLLAATSAAPAPSAPAAASTPFARLAGGRLRLAVGLGAFAGGFLRLFVLGIGIDRHAFRPHGDRLGLFERHHLLAAIDGESGMPGQSRVGGDRDGDAEAL